MSKPSAEDSIPSIIRDPNTNVCYKRGKLMGKGGFARCYELIQEETNTTCAGKIVPKALLNKPHHREKMTLEIQIHQKIHHQHIVGFHTCFEDENNVYVLLELCRNRSLMELQRRRKHVTEEEARYFVRQIVQACIYLHGRNIIHRDLKLSNVFINDQMLIKVGDFGLAAEVNADGEKKRTLCGTPNYIAPEILLKKGHSFEVDVWSVGCILYTLLVGRPPFETDKLSDTYAKIKGNNYLIPSKISTPARKLIELMLRGDPLERPNMRQVLNHEFFTKGYLPAHLPASCLITAPRTLIGSLRRPLIAIPGSNNNVPEDFWLSELHQQLNSLIVAFDTSKITANNDLTEDPKLSPIIWVAKWVDYVEKYGLGYQLNDNSFGVLFNDRTRMLVYADGENIQYMNKDGMETYFSFKNPPETMRKKITLMEYFKNYMQENLARMGENLTSRDTTSMQRMPWMRTWFKTQNAMNMHLTNGTLQINFFQDHSKMILCPLMHAITLIYPDKTARTFKMEAIQESGCTKDLQDRIMYARTMCVKMIKTPANH